MRPTVPYAIVAQKRIVQIPVMIPPMGKIMMVIPGTTNGEAEATTSVWRGGDTSDLVGVTWAANTPDTNVASSLVREVLTLAPVASTPVKVTSGTRTFCRAALFLSVFKRSRMPEILTFPCQRSITAD